ncbi:MAG TPA: apolipoprotein N-acyltransferase [Thermoanaerobaculaceae bacterium]|nr:apolipoprotein N-acyltransferase [Thermoanaerobaculaceae bacterium]
MDRDKLRPWLLAAGAGVSLALALPGPGLIPLVLVVPGLLRRALGGSHGWRAFRIGWAAGFAEWVVGVAWVVIVLHRYGHLFLPLAILGLVLMAAILGLGWGLVGVGISRVPPRWRIWALPLALAAFEEVQRFPPWIFPWNPAAAVLTPLPVLLAPAPLVGAIGLSLLAYLLGSALDALLRRESRRAGVVWLVATASAWVVLSIPSLRLFASPEPWGGPAVKVAAIQPDVPLEMRWDEANEAEIERRVWRLTREAAGAGAAWVVWPESAVPRTLERDREFRAAVEALARDAHAWLTVGAIGFGASEDEYFNSVYSVSPGGLQPGRYDKIHLVPFGEYVPLAGRIAALKALVREVGSFTPGTAPEPLTGPAGPTGIAVCYEVAYPSLFAAEVRRGAAVLATITNDGWYGDSAAPRQHLALAILRAAENRRYLVRAANTGISAIVDPLGRVLARLDFGRQGVITGEVRPISALTPFARFGGTVRGGIVALALGAIICAIGRRDRVQSRPGGRSA